MKTAIHGTAIIHEEARLGEGVEVGPYSVIGAGVVIGDGTSVGSSVLIEGNTEIGRNNRIFHGAAIGSEPQDLKYSGETTYTRIGDGNTIREYVTVNAATGEGDSTTIGNNCLLMAYVHVAHDCVVSDNVILANAVNLAGHVSVHEFAIVGGIVPVHQFVRIGAHSFIGGGSRIPKDIPPFVKVAGSPPRVCGLNSVGLKRRGFTDERLDPIRKAYRFLYRSGYNVSQAVEKIESELEMTPDVETFLDFIKSSRRGINL